MNAEKWKYIGRTVILTLGVCVVVHGGDLAAGTLTRDQHIEHEGIQRFFHVFEPDNMRAGLPLVFLLHGGGLSMDSAISPRSTGSEWLAMADEYGFVLMVPNGVNHRTGSGWGHSQHWNDCRGDDEVGVADDVGLIGKLIDLAVDRYGVDPTRVYATGASNGGFMSYRLAFELGDRIAAIAVFIANLPAVSECTVPTDPIPVFICNGDADAYVPWEGGEIVGGIGSVDRGSVISAEETLDFWISHNGCDPAPSESGRVPNVNRWDRCRAEYSIYTGPGDAKPVAFYRVMRGGHTVPTKAHPAWRFLLGLLGLGNQNRDFEGNRVAWEFLSGRQLNR